MAPDPTNLNVVVRHTEGCPNADEAEALVGEALSSLGIRADVRREVVGTHGDAERLAFPGSPTILVDGEDIFGNADGPSGLACRYYETPDGLRGIPALEELVATLDKKFRPQDRKRSA